MQPRKLQGCIWRDSNSLRFSWFCAFCFQRQSFLLNFSCPPSLTTVGYSNYIIIYHFLFPSGTLKITPCRACQLPWYGMLSESTGRILLKVANDVYRFISFRISLYGSYTHLLCPDPKRGSLGDHPAHNIATVHRQFVRRPPTRPLQYLRSYAFLK